MLTLVFGSHAFAQGGDVKYEPLLMYWNEAGTAWGVAEETQDPFGNNASEKTCKAMLANVASTEEERRGGCQKSGFSFSGCIALAKSHDYVYGSPVKYYTAYGDASSAAQATEKALANCKARGGQNCYVIPETVRCARAKRANDGGATAQQTPVPQRSPDEFEVEFSSHDFKRVRYAFFSQNRQVGWPGSDRSYTIEPYDTQKKFFKFSCQRGEKICYGAFREENNDVYWGVGRYNNKSCQNCCTTCGGKLVVDLAPGPVEPPRNELVVEMTSLDKYRVQLQLFSKNRGHVWPGSNQVWTLGDSSMHRYSISCDQGEKICYGAWREGNKKIYWGVGYDGDEACTNCCMTCGTGTHSYTLNSGPESSGGSDGAGFVSSVINGLGAAAAVASGISGGNRGGGANVIPRGNTVQRPTPRGPQPGQSDISGTHR